MHEAAVSLGHGGSLLKDLKLLKHRQKLKADSVLLAQNGNRLHRVVEKLERCMAGALCKSKQCVSGNSREHEFSPGDSSSLTTTA